MSPDQKVPGPMRPGAVFASRMREVRRRRGWSQQDLADRLAELGEPTDRATLARTETRQRGLSLDDAMAYAAALGVAFVHMVCPLENEREVVVASDMVVPARQLREWVRGRVVLDPGDDERTFLAEAPKDEWIARQHLLIDVAYRRLADVVQALADDDRDAAADLIDELNPLMVQIKREIRSGSHS